MKKRIIPFHPFLFCLYSILLFWSHNLDKIPFTEVWPVLAFSLVFTFIGQAILSVLLKNSDKAAIIMTLFMCFFFFYGHAYNLLQGIRIAGVVLGKHRNLLLIWPILFLTLSASVILMRRERVLGGLTSYFNSAGLILFCFPLFSITIFSVQYLERPIENKFGSQALETKEAYGSDIFKASPDSHNFSDIYYIILDSYTRSDVLQDLLGYDNSAFLKALRERGFYVAEKSRSNYAWTGLSLPSSLNLNYLAKDSYGELLKQENRITKVLRSKGYKIVVLPGINEDITQLCRNPDEVYRLGSYRTFLPELINTTWLYPLSFFGLFNGLYDYQREYSLFQLQKLKEIPRKENPIFVFAHIMLPHPPYIFDENGKPLKFSIGLKGFSRIPGDLWHRQEARQYVQQVVFINKAILKVLDQILSKSSGNPLIILQGDHGPMLGFSQNKVTDVVLRQRLSILNAYHLPVPLQGLLYKNITPVNSFRFILKNYFHDDYELLPDISYYSAGDDLFKFLDKITVEEKDAS